MSFIPFLVTTVIFITLYKVIELFVRRKERLTLIEKLNVSDCHNGDRRVDFSAMLSIGSSRFTSVRYGCLFVGVSLGLLVALFVNYNMSVKVLQTNREFLSLLYFASATLFGGIGLLISYAIEINSIDKADAKRKLEAKELREEERRLTSVE